MRGKRITNLRLISKESAVKFIREYAKEIGFDSYKEVEVHPNRIVCLMTYLGTSSEKPAILLNSHYDVVPCDEVKTPRHTNFASVTCVSFIQNS